MNPKAMKAMKSTGLAVAGLVVVGYTSVLLAQVARKAFNPPRVAVVDTYEVIEQYKKKAVLKAKLEEDLAKAAFAVDSLEKELKQTMAELKIVEAGTPEHREFFLKKAGLALKLNELKIRLRKELDGSQKSAIDEIRREVRREIEAYAQAHELDLVIEKKIPIEGREQTKINIPIIRFVRPEIEITNEIASILNDRYRETSP